MKDKSSLLLDAYSDCRNVVAPPGRRRSLSLSNLNMTDLNLQAENENLDVSQAFDQHRIATDIDQQTLILALTRRETRGSFSSNSSSEFSVQFLSPRTIHPRPRTASVRAPVSGPSSVVGGGADHFSPDLWVISPEERALMTNSAHFARDRRPRHGAIHLDAPLELPSPSSSSLAPCSAPHSPDPSLLPYHRIVCVPYGVETLDITSPIVPDINRAPHRGRLERSFTPSERKDAGVAIVPGLLRRLGRPFSGPWRGASSPLASVSGADAPPAGPLSRLRRVFSRRRKD
jgi:hypothetical protein